ncbi:hypothetical protein E8E12_002856 [Didymella heteroderae]|uniref:Uncharacterized protein n=1 Tax=Didymella heteroderae TaxID=1769908 RepID=A0A9P5BXL2_9PLEO|nr:hypothetical protein E8E12_002856 [Didymella heteroderae]
MFPDLASQQSFNGVAIDQVFWTFNTTPNAVEALVQPVTAQLNPRNSSNSFAEISFSTFTFNNYISFCSTIFGDNVARGESVTSSRLLGRRELVMTFLGIAMSSQSATKGTYAIIGLQGGPEIRDTSKVRWGALLPAWRIAYLQFISKRATIDSITAVSPNQTLDGAAKWYGENREPT